MCHRRFAQLFDVQQDRIGSVFTHVSASDLFAAYHALVPAIAADSTQREAIVSRWIERHRALAIRRPLQQMLESEYSLAAEARAANLLRPLTGTYRLTIRARNEPSVLLYLRTSDRARPGVATTEERPESEVPRPQELTDVSLSAHPARQAQALPVRWPAWDEERECAPLEISTAVPRARGRNAALALAGEIDLSALARCFEDQPAIQAAGDAYAESFRSAGKRRFGGTFRIFADGRVTFEQRLVVGGEELIHITGERISRTVVPE